MSSDRRYNIENMCYHRLKFQIKGCNNLVMISPAYFISRECRNTYERTCTHVECTSYYAIMSVAFYRLPSLLFYLFFRM